MRVFQHENGKSHAYRTVLVWAKSIQASILRQIVAGPRLKHAEAGLDLCYVTDRSKMSILVHETSTHSFSNRYLRSILYISSKGISKPYGRLG